MELTNNNFKPYLKQQKECKHCGKKYFESFKDPVTNTWHGGKECDCFALSSGFVIPRSKKGYAEYCKVPPEKLHSFKQSFKLKEEGYSTKIYRCYLTNPERILPRISIKF